MRTKIAPSERGGSGTSSSRAESASPGDTVIARMADQGAADQLHLQRLKKRKLMLKDEISWLESRLIPDSIA